MGNSRQKLFASKLPQLKTSSSGSQDADQDYDNYIIGLETELFKQSYDESAIKPINVLTAYFGSIKDPSTKIDQIDTILFELYGLMKHLRNSTNSDHLVVDRVIDRFIPMASPELQKEIKRRGVRFDGESFDDITELYKIFPNNLLLAFHHHSLEEKKEPPTSSSPDFPETKYTP
jgi:hypothetical protein